MNFIFISPMSSIVIVVCAFFVSISPVITSYASYCEPNLCKFMVRNDGYLVYEFLPHVACGNRLAYRNEFGPACYAYSLYNMTTEFIDLILFKHNTLRADTANGRIPGYLPANQMSELTWDSELAYLAEINAKSCIYGHDECRNTHNYRLAGQNIALNYYSEGFPRNWMLTVENFAKSYIQLWFNEYEYASMDDINSFRSITNSAGQMIGHFTQMVKSDANRVGCALVSFINRNAENSFNYYLVCNYNLENIEEKPTYTVGVPCSACRSGCSRAYPGLCSRNEITRVNFP